VNERGSATASNATLVLAKVLSNDQGRQLVFSKYRDAKTLKC